MARRRKGDVGLTTDPSDPRLGHGSDDAAIPQHEVYLILSDEERAKGFVRPVRREYVHVTCPLFGGEALARRLARTTMGQELAETYARQPSFYGATYCVHCRRHRPVGADGEFEWMDGSKVGT